jgi:inhibitor of cysteine peptidase
MQDQYPQAPLVDSKHLKWILALTSVISLCVALVIFIFFYTRMSSKISFTPFMTPGSQKLAAFTSAEEFTSYISEGASAARQMGELRMDLKEVTPSLGLPAQTGIANPQAAPSITADRYSQTNVQVVGIDEPDIVKNDGKTIFYSSLLENFYYPMMEKLRMGAPAASGVSSDIAYFPNQQAGKTHVINALPPINLANLSDIDMSGNLLLSGTTLAVLGGGKIAAYNVSDPKKPTVLWKQTLDSQELMTARLTNGKMYIVTRNYVGGGTPCPIPLFAGEGGYKIPCTAIYHPMKPISVDSTFTISQINLEDGKVQTTASFVGASGQSVVYVSPTAAYITYTDEGDLLDFYINFLIGSARDIVPASLINRLGEIKSYNISQGSKVSEMQLAIQNYQNSLSNDDKVKLETELQNRLQDYTKAHVRDLETTGIVKINLDNLGTKLTGLVPGHPLNQYSLDEWEGNLRIATTSQGSWMARTQSVNDVYILNSSMAALGSIKDLGIGEQIYSARFIGDRAYVVTFKQTDPFFVLDLSNPRNPTKAGELKIPGYSSYLHPLAQNLILGVGQEDGKVKISLFDVSNPNNPTEISKYSLDEYWTEVANNPHAFLQDDQHKVFFIPGSKAGYVFSYDGRELSLKKAIASVNAQRALYINNYLYILSPDKIVVINEADWETVNSLSF